MSPRIARIEDAGPDRKARRLTFEDGIEPRITSASVVKELGLEEGLSIDADVLEASLAEVELLLAKERALRLLGYRERSRAELVRKLCDSGYPEAIASQVAERFAEIELLDDERFAAVWVRTRNAAGFGARRIARELAEKGLAPETAAAALEAISGGEDQVARARQTLRGRIVTDNKERDKLIRRLVAKGFSLSVAVQAVDSCRSGDDDTL
ncbi:MAG TPA: regulatory protein RecX [Coriobacteriia bacterium]